MNLLGPSWRSPGASWAPLGLSWTLLGRSWGHLGDLLDCLGVVGGLLVCFAASGSGKRQTPQIFQKIFEKLMIFVSRSLLGKRLGGFLERSGGLSACIGTILGVLGSPLGRLHGGFLERLGGFLTGLGAILGVLGRCLGDSGPSWAVIAASWGPLGLSWSLLGPQKVMRGVAGSPRWDATNPRLIATRGSEPWKNSSGVTTEAQGTVR